MGSGLFSEFLIAIEILSIIVNFYVSQCSRGLKTFLAFNSMGNDLICFRSEVFLSYSLTFEACSMRYCMDYLFAILTKFRNIPRGWLIISFAQPDLYPDDPLSGWHC